MASSSNPYQMTTDRVCGQSVFFPAAGYRNGSYLYNAGSYGDYWTSSPGSSHYIYSYYLYFSSGGAGMDYYDYRSLGRSVRAVCQ